jgi:hypothetical protein
VLAYAGLGGEQGVCCVGEVEVLPDRFPNDAQLLKIHI